MNDDVWRVIQIFGFWFTNVFITFLVQYWCRLIAFPTKDTIQPLSDRFLWLLQLPVSFTHSAEIEVFELG